MNDEMGNLKRALRTAGLSFVIALTGAVAPGPVLVLIIGQVLAQGIRAAVFILLGHALIEAVFIVCLARGLKNLLKNYRVRSVLGLIGGLVLAWMGWEILRGAGGASLSGRSDAAMSALTLVLAGVGVSLSNPYFTGWWATVGVGQVATLRFGRPRDYAAFFLGHELGDMAWYLFVAMVIIAGRSWLDDHIYRMILGVCAGAILLLGGLFIFLSLRLLGGARPRQGGN